MFWLTYLTVGETFVREAFKHPQDLVRFMRLLSAEIGTVLAVECFLDEA